MSQNESNTETETSRNEERDRETEIKIEIEPTKTLPFSPSPACPIYHLYFYPSLTHTSPFPVHASRASRPPSNEDSPPLRPPGLRTPSRPARPPPQARRSSRARTDCHVAAQCRPAADGRPSVPRRSLDGRRKVEGKSGERSENLLRVRKARFGDEISAQTVPITAVVCDLEL